MVKTSIKETINFYNQAATCYDSYLNACFYQHIAEALLKLIPHTHNVAFILEVGAGTGFATLCLQKQYPGAAIVALEPAPAMLVKGEKRAPKVLWQNKTLSEFQPQHQFDLVFCSMAGHWLSEEELNKLINLAKNNTLALALPSCFLSQEVVSQTLKKLLFQLKPKPLWAPAQRKLSRLLPKLGCFSQILLKEIIITEHFLSLNQLIKTINSRGVFVALFGSQANTAEKLFYQELTDKSNQSLAMSWRIQLITASHKSGRSPQNDIQWGSTRSMCQSSLPG